MFQKTLNIFAAEYLSKNMNSLSHIPTKSNCASHVNEFGMIFAERERERERESYIKSITRTRAEVKKIFPNRHTAKTVWRFIIL